MFFVDEFLVDLEEVVEEGDVEFRDNEDGIEEVMEIMSGLDMDLKFVKSVVKLKDSKQLNDVFVGIE